MSLYHRLNSVLFCFCLSLHLCRETLRPVGSGWCLDWYERQLQNRFPWQVWWDDSSEAQLVSHSGRGGDCGLFVSGYGTYLQLWGHWQWVRPIILHKQMHLEKRACGDRVVSVHMETGGVACCFLAIHCKTADSPGLRWSCSFCSEQLGANVLRWMNVKRDLTTKQLDHSVAWWGTKGKW